MASFSATEAAFEGFRLTREHPLAVLGWIVAYFVFYLALSLLAIIWGVGQDLADLRTLLQSADPSFAELTRMFDKLAPYVLVVAPLQMVFFAVLNCAIYRAVLRPYERGIGYFRLGADEVRMLALTIILFVIWLTLLFAVTLVASMAASTVGLFGGMVGALFGAVVGLASFCAAIWVLVRLSLAAPMTFAERRLVVFGSWNFTHGKFWSLTGAYILAFALGVVVLLLLSVILSVVARLSGQTTESLSGIGADASSIGAFLTVPTLLAQVFSAIIIIANYVLLLSPSAIAYRGLAGMETHPQVFA